MWAGRCPGTAETSSSKWETLCKSCPTLPGLSFSLCQCWVLSAGKCDFPPVALKADFLFSFPAKSIGLSLPTLCELGMCLCVYLFGPEKKSASHSSALRFLKPSEVCQLKPQFRKRKTCPHFTVPYKFLHFSLKSEAAGDMNQAMNCTKWLLKGYHKFKKKKKKSLWCSKSRTLNSNCF